MVGIPWVGTPPVYPPVCTVPGYTVILLVTPLHPTVAGQPVVSPLDHRWPDVSQRQMLLANRELLPVVHCCPSVQNGLRDAAELWCNVGYLFATGRTLLVYPYIMTSSG